jgi:hypothetical protein
MESCSWMVTVESLGGRQCHTYDDATAPAALSGVAEQHQLSDFE